MECITMLIERVKDAKEQLENGTLMEDIILQNEPYICDMNSETQLYDNGENNLGVRIMDYMPYSPVTIQIKKSKGQPYNRVTLHDEGDFARSFFVETDNEKFTIRASDWKAEDLVMKYGRQILGLTFESQEELTWQYVYPDLTKKIKELIYGK